MTPAAAETLTKIRSRADHVLALLLVAHFPVALGLAAVHGTWLTAVLWGGAISGTCWWLAHTQPGAVITRFAIAAGLMG